MKHGGVKLSTPLSELKGVGDVVGRGLGRLGLVSVQDLLEFFPRRWDDYSAVHSIAQIRPGLVTVVGRVEHLESRRSFKNKRLSVTEAIIADGTGTIRVVWFNQPFIKAQLKEGGEYVFQGKFEFKNNYLSLQNPSFEVRKTTPKAHIVPIYKENNAITSKLISKLVGQVIGLADELDDALPTEVLEGQKLLGYSQAISELHRPTSTSLLAAARDRLAFEELFMLMTTALALKHDIKLEPALPVEFNLAAIESVLSTLSFQLTDAQKKAAWAVFQDMGQAKPMNRLLEGDVGSGKTIVALLAAYLAISQGFQAALMVPTEILARQHLASSAKLLGGLGVEINLLVGSLKQSEKTKVRERIASHEAQLVIGTHALLEENVQFSKLGLVIIDEQHRFGVNQRRLLKAQSETMPHVMTMTATPIPRSLALVVYGELDVSIIDELPPGRKPVKTKLVVGPGRADMEAHIEDLLATGQQAFVVCPLIEESDSLGVKSVQAEFARLSSGVFSHRTIEVLHGKLKPAEKEHIMAEFAAGKIDILIATTVIEVGVDIPNASVMIIESAERFGLAALHQLRGRVGRSGQQAFCYLLTDSDNPLTLQRLRALEKTTDGFRLSQIDLEMRGPGEIYGARQHGVLDLRMANVMDTKLIERVRIAAEAFLATGNMVKYPHMLKRLNQLKAITTLD